MTSRELVQKTIRGENNTGRTPLYAWVRANLQQPISERFGSVEAFEDAYRLDMAHIFGGPAPYTDNPELDAYIAAGVEITPDVLLSVPLNPVNDMDAYALPILEMKHHRERDRFCYVQTNGIFECLNAPFGIENHLLYMAMFPDELAEVYRRQAEWNRAFAMNMIELGIDMIHVSDDWGAQRSLLFSVDMWRELIYPNHAVTARAVKDAGAFLSLHSDGNVMDVLDGIVALGYDVVHPWQESAGMSYEAYLNGYADKFALLGGLCIQSTVGFGDYRRLESEIRRVFGLLRGKRWMCCTTHYVQEHCTMDELVFTYDLARKLADG